VTTWRRCTSGPATRSPRGHNLWPPGWCSETQAKPGRRIHGPAPGGARPGQVQGAWGSFITERRFGGRAADGGGNDRPDCHRPGRLVQVPRITGALVARPGALGGACRSTQAARTPGRPTGALGQHQVDSALPRSWWKPCRPG